MTMNALDTALVQLAEASNALERQAPTIKDVEGAEKAAKAASEIIAAARKLMGYGIYTVCDEPAGAYLDVAEHKIEMPELPGELPPCPALFEDDFLEDTPKGQHTAFGSLLEDLDNKVWEKLPDLTDWDSTPWWEAFDADRLLAWKKLQFTTHHREPFAYDVPSDEAFAAWRAGFAPDPEPSAVVEEAEVLAQDAKAGLGEFQQLLDELEELGVIAGLKRKDWKKAHKAWWSAFDADQLGTFSKLQALVDSNNVASWAIPIGKGVA